MSYKLVLHAGPDLTDVRPEANPLVRTPQPLFRGKKWKASINLRKSENYTLKVRSLKSSQSLLKCPRSLHLLLPSTQKRLIARNCWNLTLLAGTGLLTTTGKPTEITTVEIFDTIHGLRFFIRITSVSKKKQTHCTYMV